jgi:hypothetical protein
MKQLKRATIAGAALVATTATYGLELKLSENQKIDFHGFASQGFLASTDYNYLGKTTDGSGQLTEAGVNASYSPFNRTRITVQGFAFDTGRVGNMVPFLDYASLEYTFSDSIGIRAGRVRKPGGIYNHIQDLDLARTAILLPQGIYDARWRDFSTSIDGAVIFGSVPLGKAGSLSYEFFGGLVTLSDDGGVAQWIVDGSNNIFKGFGQPVSAGGQLWWNTPVSGLRVGSYTGYMNDFTFDIVTPVSPVGPFGPINANVSAKAHILLQQYSVEYTWKQWTFQAEYFTYDYEGANTVNVLSGAVPIAPTSTSSSTTQPDAWYLGAAYRINDWMEVGSYYTEHYGDIHQRSGSPNASQKDLALSLRFDPKPWWILKLEAHYIRGTSLLEDTARNPQALRTDEGWWLFAAKTTFSF